VSAYIGTDTYERVNGDTIDFHTEKEQADSLTLSIDSINFAKESETDSFTINTNLKVTDISSSQTWCTVSYDKDDPKIVEITVEKNDSTSSRNAIIFVTAINPATNEEADKAVAVKQEAGEDNNDDWVLINGVKWATRNVGEPGTFVQNPEDYGNYYSWEEAPNVCPAGYRLPNTMELASLNSSNVTRERTTQNGVAGFRFTDLDTGKTLFLPTAGHKKCGSCEVLAAEYAAYYWSSEMASDVFAWGRYWRDEGFTCDDLYGPVEALSIRPVVE